jgi:hypothetical protein
MPMRKGNRYQLDMRELILADKVPVCCLYALTNSCEYHNRPNGMLRRSFERNAEAVIEVDSSFSPEVRRIVVEALSHTKSFALLDPNPQQIQ